MTKINLDISKLKDCTDSLRTCKEDYEKANDAKIKEYIEDACIKRYEFTVETAWKLMKKYLKLQYGKTDKELTMNNIFRYMEGYGFVQSWENWRDYYDKRNDTSHEYNKEKAKEVLNYIDNLIQDADFLYNQLKTSLGE